MDAFQIENFCLQNEVTIDYTNSQWWTLAGPSDGLSKQLLQDSARARIETVVLRLLSLSQH